MSGRRMDLRMIARAGASRTAALEKADARTDQIADELLDAGELANVDLAAKVSGVPRSTLYRRMNARRIARARRELELDEAPR